MTLQHVVLGMLILPMYINASPNSKGKFEQILEQGEPELYSKMYSLQNNNRDESNLTKGRRQKRFREYYDYESSNRQLSYVSYPKIDHLPHTDVHGSVDPLTEIHRRLQEIADFVKQPSPPRPQSPNTYYDPAIFKSQTDCICDHEINNPLQKPVSEKTQTIPNIRNTFPDVAEKNQSGGFKKVGTGDGEDFSRPISFDPIRPDKALVRPAPQVEHGSSQASAQGNTPTTTVQANALNDVTHLNPYPPSVGTSSSMHKDSPTKCDRVLLSCCHMLQVTYNCFVSQGCFDLLSHGKPCEPKVLLKAIEKFQKFYVLNNR